MYFLIETHRRDDRRQSIGYMFGKHGGTYNRWSVDDHFMAGNEEIPGIPVCTHHFELGDETVHNTLPTTWTMGTLKLSKHPNSPNVAVLNPTYDRKVYLTVTSSPQYTFMGFGDFGPLLQMRHGNVGPPAESTDPATIIRLDSPMAFPMTLTPNVLFNNETRSPREALVIPDDSDQDRNRRPGLRSAGGVNILAGPSLPAARSPPGPPILSPAIPISPSPQASRLPPTTPKSGAKSGSKSGSKSGGRSGGKSGGKKRGGKTTPSSAAKKGKQLLSDFEAARQPQLTVDSSGRVRPKPPVKPNISPLDPSQVISSAQASEATITVTSVFSLATSAPSFPTATFTVTPVSSRSQTAAAASAAPTGSGEGSSVLTTLEEENTTTEDTTSPPKKRKERVRKSDRRSYDPTGPYAHLSKHQRYYYMEKMAKATEEGRLSVSESEVQPMSARERSEIDVSQQVIGLSVSQANVKPLRPIRPGPKPKPTPPAVEQVPGMRPLQPKRSRKAVETVTKAPAETNTVEEPIRVVEPNTSAPTPSSSSVLPGTPSSDSRSAARTRQALAETLINAPVDPLGPHEKPLEVEPEKRKRLEKAFEKISSPKEASTMTDRFLVNLKNISKEEPKIRDEFVPDSSPPAGELPLLTIDPAFNRWLTSSISPRGMSIVVDPRSRVPVYPPPPYPEPAADLNTAFTDPASIGVDLPLLSEDLALSSSNTSTASMSQTLPGLPADETYGPTQMDETGGDQSYFQAMPFPSSASTVRHGPTPPTPNLDPGTLNTPVYTSIPGVQSLRHTYSHGTPGAMLRLDDPPLAGSPEIMLIQQQLEVEVAGSELHSDISVTKSEPQETPRGDGGRGGGDPREGGTQH